MAPSASTVTVVRNLVSSTSTTTVMTGAAGRVAAMPAPDGKHKPTFPVRPGTAARKSAGSGGDSVLAMSGGGPSSTVSGGGSAVLGGGPTLTLSRGGPSSTVLGGGSAVSGRGSAVLAGGSSARDGRPSLPVGGLVVPNGRVAQVGIVARPGSRGPQSHSRSYC